MSIKPSENTYTYIAYTNEYMSKHSYTYSYIFVFSSINIIKTYSTLTKLK